MRIKKVLVFLCITVLSIGFFGCSSTGGKNKSNWVVSKTINIPHKNNIGGFYDDNFGITVGYSGEVHYTNDGGVNWPKSNNISFCRFGLDIVNEKIAWNCGNAGHVRKTTDGGQNWENATDFGEYQPNQCRYLSFLNENVGWIASPKKLGATEDGGKKWTEIKLPEGMGNIMAINLLNQNKGYLIDTKNKLYTTNNRGLSWDTKEINAVDIDNTIWPSNASYLRFMDEKNGTFFYYNKDAKLKCLITKDGGDTWDNQVIPDIEGDGLYLSSDGKLLSINSDKGNKITILKHK